MPVDQAVNAGRDHARAGFEPAGDREGGAIPGCHVDLAPGEVAPDVAAIVDRFAALGYVDDAAFAEARAASLARRGYGARRVSASLRAAGIGEADAAFVTQENQSRARAVALAYARRRRIGPFAPAPMDRPAREKALAAMIRAGHDFEVAREILSLAAADVPEWAKVNNL